MIQTRAQQDGLPHTLVISNFPATPAGQLLERRNPANRDDLVTVFPASSREQVFAACETAREAAVAWARVPAPERGRLLGRLAKLLTEEKERQIGRAHV